MYTDLFGNNRLKINLHTHTTLTDGLKTPAEVVKIYKDAGYDAISITDHWLLSKEASVGGLKIIPGIECNIRHDSIEGVFHILGINVKNELSVTPESSPGEITKDIIRCGGLPILAHPAWSVNSAEQGMSLSEIGITEIYNSVSDAHESSRPYSGYFADVCACKGKLYSLIATDDAHYYDGTDEAKSFIMLKCKKDATCDEMVEAIKKGDFYASQGPELHICKKGDKVVITSSPVSKISLFSNLPWNNFHCIRGENITGYEYTPPENEAFIRAEAVDENGRCAWTNFISLR